MKEGNVFMVVLGVVYDAVLLSWSLLSLFGCLNPVVLAWQYTISFYLFCFISNTNTFGLLWPTLLILV
jgi:hypothetical protein